MHVRVGLWRKLLLSHFSRVQLCATVQPNKQGFPGGLEDKASACNEGESEVAQSCPLKNWCFGTVVLEKTLESPLDCKEIQPVHSKGDQSWVFIGRTDVEAETPILWPPDEKSWLTGKDPDAGKDRRQEEKGATEDEMVGWYHRLNGHEFKQLPETVKDRKPWCAAVHGVTKSQTWLSD